MKSDKINTRLYFLIFFLSFLGYYAILLLGFNLGYSQESRKVTVPLRLGIILLMGILTLRNLKNLHGSSTLSIFIFFSIFYLGRIFMDYYNGIDYYLSVEEVFLYFIAFDFIPFTLLAIQNIKEKYLTAIFHALFYGGLAFSILAIVFYGKYIGTVGRLSNRRVDEEVLSPLILSYNSVMVIGVLIFYLLTHTVKKWKKLMMLCAIGLSVIPFFLGASRGSLLALFVPFLIYFYYSVGVKEFFKTIVIVIIVIVGLIFLDDYLDSGLLKRFLSTSDSVRGAADPRVLRYKSSFNQFLENPYFGDSIAVRGFKNYPHNIFLEVLQSVGIVGFIPFLVILGRAFKICLNIFKYRTDLIWVAVVFIQALMHNMVSGGFYKGFWTWTSLGLIFAVGHKMNKKKLK